MKSYGRTVWILFSMGLLLSTTSSIMTPFLSLYLNKSLGVSAPIIGVLYLAMGLLTLVSAPICGTLCDRFGRKRVLVASTLTLVAGNVALALITLAANIYLFALVYTVVSVFRIWPLVAIDIVVSDVGTMRSRLEIYGLMSAGQNAGFAVGSLLGGFYAASPTLIFAISAVVGVLPFVTGSLLMEETQPKASGRVEGAGMLGSFREVVSSAVRDRVVLAFLGILTVVALVWGQFYGLFPIYAVKYAGLSSAEVGVSYALEGSVLAILSYSVNKWASRFNLISVYAAGALFFALASLGVGAFTTFAGVLVFYGVGEAFAEMLCGPSSRAIMARLSPSDKRGRYMGLLYIFQKVTSYAPVVGGVLMDALAPNLMVFWLIFTILALLAGVLCFPLNRIAKDRLSGSTPD
jgi:MFS family permease